MGMTDIAFFIQDVLDQYYNGDYITTELHQYGSYIIAIVVPLVTYVFLLGCIYKILTSIMEGVR